jgi:site-specific DNA-methyltransferase (adenine-specific)
VTNNCDERIHFVSKSSFCSKCGAWKGQLGLEPTFDLFLKHLCDTFDEVKRVLKKTGTCWVNLGDTYSTVSGRQGKGDQYGKQPKFSEEADNNMPKKIRTDLSNKCLLQIPSRFSIEMINRGWIMRNLIVWHKPNCIPSSARDRFTVDFEFIMFFVKNRKYFFEQQFEDWTDNNKHDIKRAVNGHKEYDGKWKDAPKGMAFPESKIAGNPLLGRNKRSVWTIATHPFPEAHFAVFPETLVETPIKAGCPEFICKKCGKAREKIFERLPINNGMPTIRENRKELHASTYSRHRTRIPGGQSLVNGIQHLLGYFDCGCGAAFEPGIVLDPFCGSGTTCIVAKKLGRKWIGIDINGDYCKMARRRLGQVREGQGM